LKRGETASTRKGILGRSEFKTGKLDLPGPLAQPPKCPECTSQKLWRDGLLYTKQGEVQRWLCRNCGRRFSDPKIKVDIIKQSLVLSDPVHNLRQLNSVDVAFGKVGLKDSALTVRKDIASHDFAIVGKPINSLLHNSRECQVCVSENEAKNLSQQPKTRQKRAAGATEKPTQAKVKGKLVEFAWWMKKQGYRESTILTSTHQMTILAKRGANLLDPESVKEIIASQPWAESRKAIAVSTYNRFLKMLGLKWEKPIYKPVRKLPFIPTEKEIDNLIAGCGKKTSTYLQLLKETGMRSGEANNLKWSDIDFDRRIVRITPGKNSNPRITPLSVKCIAMLNNLPRKDEKVFGKIAPSTMRRGFMSARKRLAKKLNNPRLMQIHFHTLRHWKGTTLYHQTKDVVYVKQFLGHRVINNTMLYIQLEKALFDPSADQFTCKIAGTEEEIKQLIEAGFEYVIQNGGLAYFRKRK